MNPTELFDYRDGDIYWKKNGKQAGTITKSGRKQIGYKGKTYLAHRVIFLMHHGYLPSEIDHIDGNPLNNRIENLRSATRYTNNMNVGVNKRNSSGVKGVMWNPRDKKWTVRFNVFGKIKSFGQYYDINVAKFVVETMRHKYHGKFANNG